MALQLVHNTDKNGRPVVARVALQGLTLAGRDVLGKVAFELRQGETVALTGPSGVGKTSLLRVMAGLEKRNRGDVDCPKNIAFVFQEPTLLLWRNLLDNLCIPLGISTTKAEKALDEVGLAGRGDTFPGQLSLGQQRRLSLARAFAADPELLLMDEPFVSLDDSLADDMMTLFEDLRTGRTITTMIVTHSKREAARLSDRVLTLTGSPAQLGQ
ncbi:MAG: ABC transporter ATP-binding protein [Pelagimonas sp.]|uniref:ABC transporter ATP-binding protein n=1 Tax=Pelagimonas sp. TaxID=2073170 RepID=UPI003D6C555E